MSPIALLALLACTKDGVAPEESEAPLPDDSAPVDPEDTWPEVEVEEIEAAVEPGLLITPAGGGFVDRVEVTLAIQGTEGDIWYTLDGSLPEEGRATLYTGPIELSGNTRLRALAVGVGGLVDYGAEAYVRLEGEAATFSSNLPLLVLSSNHRLPESDAEHTPFAMLVFEPGDDGRSRMVGDATLSSRIGLKVRGSSSASYPKKPYGVEVWSPEEDDDFDLAVLGMPPESDWVLLAPLNFDRALMRNALVYALSNDVGRYAPRTRFVEVFADGGGGTITADDYVGVYVVEERIKRGPDRVAVSVITPQDNAEPELTGGFIWKEDRREPDEDGFTAGTAGGAFYFQQRFVFAYPKEAEVTAQQEAYLVGQLDTLGEALAAADHIHPTLGVHYSALIDVDAWIDHHILNLYPKNPDAFRLSGFFHKDREGLMVAGPVWDFDRTMGCASDSRPTNPTWWDPRNQTSDTTAMFDHGFWRGLFADPAFAEAYWARLGELLDDELSVANVHGHIDAMAAELSEAAPRNYARWSSYGPRGGTFEAEVQLLKDWTAQRNAWMEGCLEAYPDDPLSCRGT